MEQELIFVSKDGINIFEGDCFYSVTDDLKVIYSDAVKGMRLTKQIISRSFSTAEKAQDFISEQEIIYEIDTVNWKVIKTIYHHFPNYFKTEKEANEYILMNKPCLSVKDVFSLIEHSYHPSEENIREYEVVELAKKKLNSVSV